ncbi:DNA repair protein RadA/Sms [Nakamurella panacisegetis]|uniref:DNA repair protein RadA n=1 Tax=Nakamurella panacisegetis TaxID=1090615 RepID=A0A1H0NQH5_9ACTN|nr:DNA repair protein RadA [Nakamurella panacisegetis]SDO94816.1 DNA repair protein RadA/Sms [Nakamurella panacisegetis]
MSGTSSFSSRPSAGSSASSRAAARAARPAFHCTECGASVAKWAGRCPQCQAWGSLSEVGATRAVLRKVTAGPVTAAAQPIGEIDATQVTAKPSGVAELDRVLGGGLVPGGVVLLAGEPGVGKSTLLLSAAHAWAKTHRTPSLIVTGEESAPQVRMRADRMGCLHPNLYLAAETEMSAVLAHIDAVNPGLLILDSVQTVSMAEVDGSAGGVTQVRAVAATLTAIAKERGIACVLVGHVTKDGAIAGPRVLEHLVDVVLHFEGDRNSPLRLIRGVKNRFGPADEVGCFKMVEDGIVGLTDASGLFLSGRKTHIPGTCSMITMQGRRAIPVELQALVSGTEGDGPPRRTFSGLDASRAAMVLAVLHRLGGVSVAKKEVLAATVGGVRINEPAADLPLAMAVWSSVRDIPLAPGLVMFGELGLSAEIRPVQNMDRRLAEASRLGFDHAVIPGGGDIHRPTGMRVDRVEDLGEAMRALGNDSGVTRWLERRAN